MKNNILKTTIILAFVFFQSCINQENINWKQYDAITNIDELVAFYPNLNLDRSGKSETAEISKYLDGSKELAYEYDLTESLIYDPLYYSVTIEVALTEKDARESFTITKGALILGSKIADLEEKEVNNLDLPGDQNYYAIRTFEGLPNGLLYISRRGKRVYTLIISGVYADDHSIITDLILPDIASLDTFTL